MSYKEFNSALNIKEPLIFGKQKLVLNSAKNKYDNIEDEMFKENYSFQFYEDRKSLDSLTQNLSTTETGLSSLRNSKESNISYNNNKIKQENNSDENNNELNVQIMHSLKKMSEQYYQYDNKCSLFNYYCSPFRNNSNYKKDYYFDNKDKVDLFVNNNKDVYVNCPFESCKDK